MNCPYCANDRIHIESLVVNRGGEITSVDYRGTGVRAGAPSGRGALIEIIFWCETGHKWKHSIQFHKGAVSTEDRLLENGCPNCMQGTDLWRN
jgi:hypothetical protein